MQIPVPIHELVAPLVVEGTDGLGERLVRTMLAIWESDLQAPLMASLRTAVAEPATTRSMQEFLAVEVLGQCGCPDAVLGELDVESSRLSFRRTRGAL